MRIAIYLFSNFINNINFLYVARLVGKLYLLEFFLFPTPRKDIIKSCKFNIAEEQFLSTTTSFFNFTKRYIVRQDFLKIYIAEAVSPLLNLTKNIVSLLTK